MTSPLIVKAKKYGFLARSCKACDQRMVVARSGKQCVNCGGGQ